MRRFFIGLHKPQHAGRFARCMVSISVLRKRRSDFIVNDWMLDSGAFTEVTKHGGFREPPEVYARQIERWARCGNLLAAVAQDYMCEDVALKATGLTVRRHQELTIERYDALLRAAPGAPVLPVLQGFEPSEYAAHLDMYGDRLVPGAWVGVGSVCKRNGNPGAIEAVLSAIKLNRPDLRLHGFGLKKTALGCAAVWDLLETADSMAWSYAARRQGRNANSPLEAQAYVERIESIEPVQSTLWRRIGGRAWR